MATKLYMLLCCLFLVQRFYVAVGGRSYKHYRHVSDSHEHDGHGSDSHEHDSHEHDSHGDDSHDKDSHDSDSHEHDSHGSDSHEHDSHGSDSHGKHERDSDSHESDSHESDSHGHGRKMHRFHRKGSHEHGSHESSHEGDSHEHGGSHEHKHHQHGGDYHDASNLLDRLLSGYNRHVLPQKESGVAVNVSVGGSFVQLSDIDVDDGEIEATLWLIQGWNDPRLSWDREYHDVEQLAIPADHIWVPDFAYYNSIKEPEETLGFREVLVLSSGDVIFVSSMRVRTTCAIPEGNSFTCKYVVGSWVHDERYLDVYSESYYKDVQDSFTKKGWALESVTSERFAKQYPCCKGVTYPSMHFTFTFKRT